jgi:hypothetical protein
MIQRFGLLWRCSSNPGDFNPLTHDLSRGRMRIIVLRLSTAWMLIVLPDPLRLTALPLLDVITVRNVITATYPDAIGLCPR